MSLPLSTVEGTNAQWLICYCPPLFELGQPHIESNLCVCTQRISKWERAKQQAWESSLFNLCSLLKHQSTWCSAFNLTYFWWAANFRQNSSVHSLFPVAFKHFYLFILFLYFLWQNRKGKHTFGSKISKWKEVELWKQAGGREKVSFQRANDLLLHKRWVLKIKGREIKTGTENEGLPVQTSRVMTYGFGQ